MGINEYGSIADPIPARFSTSERIICLTGSAKEPVHSHIGLFVMTWIERHATSSMLQKLGTKYAMSIRLSGPERSSKHSQPNGFSAPQIFSTLHALQYLAELHGPASLIIIDGGDNMDGTPGGDAYELGHSIAYELDVPTIVVGKASSTLAVRLADASYPIAGNYKALKADIVSTPVWRVPAIPAKRPINETIGYLLRAYDGGFADPLCLFGFGTDNAEDARDIIWSLSGQSGPIFQPLLQARQALQNPDKKL